MTTSNNKYDSIEKLILDQNLKIASLEVNPQTNTMFIHLNNGNMFVVRLSFYKNLSKRSKESLQHYKLIADGRGIHWPDLDEDLSLKGFVKDFLEERMRTEKELVIGKTNKEGEGRNDW